MSEESKPVAAPAPEAKPAPPKPTHELKIRDPESDEVAVIGRAWFRSDNGSIAIRLIPGVMLTFDNMKRKQLALFPIKEVVRPVAVAPVTSVVQPSKPPDMQTPTQWKKEHPDYVRKVHYHFASRSQCPNRVRGKPQVTEDVTKVTCILCKEVADRMTRQPAGAPTTNVVPLTKPPAEAPKDPTPAA
jgi:hypothetical protein